MMANTKQWLGNCAQGKNGSILPVHLGQERRHLVFSAVKIGVDVPGVLGYFGHVWRADGPIG